MPIPALVAGAATMASPLIYGYGRHIFSNDTPAPVVQNSISNLTQLSEQAARNNADLNTAIANASTQTNDPVSAFLAGYSRIDPVFLNNGTSTDLNYVAPVATATPAKTVTKTASPRTSTKTSSSGSKTNSQSKIDLSNLGSGSSPVRTNSFDWLNDLLPLLAAGGLGYLLAK